MDDKEQNIGFGGRDRDLPEWLTPAAIKAMGENGNKLISEVRVALKAAAEAFLASLDK